MAPSKTPSIKKVKKEGTKDKKTEDTADMKLSQSTSTKFLNKSTKILVSAKINGHHELFHQ